MRTLLAGFHRRYARSAYMQHSGRRSRTSSNLDGSGSVRLLFLIQPCDRLRSPRVSSSCLHASDPLARVSPLPDLSLRCSPLSCRRCCCCSPGRCCSCGAWCSSAWPRAWPEQPVQAHRHPGTGRTGLHFDGAPARGGKAAAPGCAAQAGLFQTAGDYVAVHLAGGVVVVPDRHQPGQAQHLRFPNAGPQHLSTEVEFRRDSAATTHTAPGEISHPARQGRCAPAAQEPAVLVLPGYTRHLQ